MRKDTLIPVQVTVTLWLKPDADVAEVLQEMEYDFKHDDAIVDMEITDTNTEV